MKKMLIAAAAVGAALAGLILYSQKRRERPAAAIKDAAEDAYKTVNQGIGQIERGAVNTLDS